MEAWADELGVDPSELLRDALRRQLVRLAGALSGKPVVVYPNSGERWDAAGRRWVGPTTDLAGAVPGWLADGAALVGGCCRVEPDAIAAIAAEVAGRRSQPTHTQP